MIIMALGKLEILTVATLPAVMHNNLKGVGWNGDAMFTSTCHNDCGFYVSVAVMKVHEVISIYVASFRLMLTYS